MGGWLTAGDGVLGAAMALLCAYYVVNPGIFEGKGSGDGLFGYQYLRAIVHEHTLDMIRVIPQYKPYFGVGGPGMHMPNRCPFGPVYVWMPFYLLGSALQWLLEHARRLPPGNGQMPLQLWVTGLGTLAMVLVGWRQLYVLLRRHLGRDAARIGAIAAVWATPIVWYTVTQPLYQHGLAFAFLAILVEQWDRGRGDPGLRRFAWLGVLGGLAISMRAQEGLYLLLPGVEVAVGVVRGPERRRWLCAGLLLCAVTFLVTLPQLMVWRYYTGSLFVAPQTEPMRWSSPSFIIALFSTRAGLFAWSPVVYSALAGFLFYKRARVLALALAAVFAVEVYVVASAWSVWGGWTYGARRLSDGALLFGLGVALLWAGLASGVARKFAAAFVGLCIALNLLAMEALRAGAITSSGAHPHSATSFLKGIHAPAPVVRLFDRIGYPFVQPMGWLYALRWHAPVTMFENVVGHRLLERDEHWFQLQLHVLPFSDVMRAFAVDGVAVGEHEPATVTGPVRMLFPMFAKEPFTIDLEATVPKGATAARWNGTVVPLRPHGKGLQLTIAAAIVRADLNELQMTLPVGAKLHRITFLPTSSARPK
jgi:hypothetical protein